MGNYRRSSCKITHHYTATLAEDMGLTIHPHPTLSETLGEAAEIFLGSVTHILPKKKRR